MQVVSGKQTMDWAQAAMLALSKRPDYGTLSKVWEAMSQESGLSVSFLQKFSQGRYTNTRVDTLDRIVSSIRRLEQSKAA